MGAGIPLKIPGALDRLANHGPACYELRVMGAKRSDETAITFVPRDFAECDLPPLLRPKFLPIIASNALAIALLRKANGRIDGFVVEGPTAGGHNAPPRGNPELSGAGEPIYGERDKVDLQEMRKLGLPFWLAGGYGSAEKLREALAAGATGVQVGTAFAFCAESDLRADYKQALLMKALCGEAKAFTDSSASPTGYPFKVAQLKGTISESEVYLARPRICDLGYLREPFRTEAGTIDYRCAAQPVSIYLSKGGKIEDTVGRICLCNALVANVGLPQIRAGKYVETGLVTSGDDLREIPSFLPPDSQDYNAADVIAKLLDA
jgi:nitronate monooxygenase